MLIVQLKVQNSSKIVNDDQLVMIKQTGVAEVALSILIK